MARVGKMIEDYIPLILLIYLILIIICCSALSVICLFFNKRFIDELKKFHKKHKWIPRGLLYKNLGNRKYETFNRVIFYIFGIVLLIFDIFFIRMFLLVINEF